MKKLTAKQLRDMWIEFYKEKGLFEEYKNEIEYTYTRFLLCSSLLRMVKVGDKKIRKDLEQKTWQELNKNFPNWKQNPILKKEKGTKNLYMKLVNKTNFNMICNILEKI